MISFGINKLNLVNKHKHKHIFHKFFLVRKQLYYKYDKGGNYYYHYFIFEIHR